MNETETEYPKATILPGEDFFTVRVFLGENEIPYEVWSADVKYLGPGELKLILEVPISAVEFKRVD